MPLYERLNLTKSVLGRLYYTDGENAAMIFGAGVVATHFLGLVRPEAAQSTIDRLAPHGKSGPGSVLASLLQST